MAKEAKQKVWFITGASSGFGQVLVQQLLDRGDMVVATSRDQSNFDEIKNPNFLGLEVKELDNQVQVKEAVEATIKKFNRIDVVVNNAGYGQVGPFEEQTREEIEAEFKVNLFGPMMVAREFLPLMREQKSGKIVNISSVAGFLASTGSSSYNATKFALDGWSDALAQEVKPFNIQVVSIYPGGYRTKFSGASIKIAAHRLDDYKEFDTNLVAWRKQMDGNQPGDPEVGMQTLIKVVDLPQSPGHFILGEDAVEDYAVKKDKLWTADLKTSQALNKEVK